MDPKILAYMDGMMRRAGYSEKAIQRALLHLNYFDNMEQVEAYNESLRRRSEKLKSREGSPEAQMKYMRESPYTPAIREQIREKFRTRDRKNGND